MMFVYKNCLKNTQSWGRQLFVRQRADRVRVALQVAIRHLGISPGVVWGRPSRGRALAETGLVLILDVLVDLRVHARGIDRLLDPNCPPGAAGTIADVVAPSALTHSWVRVPFPEVHVAASAAATSLRDGGNLVRVRLVDQVAILDERTVRGRGRLFAAAAAACQVAHLPPIAFFLGALQSGGNESGAQSQRSDLRQKPHRALAGQQAASLRISRSSLPVSRSLAAVEWRRQCR